MGKQSSTDPMRAATRLCGETCGRIARRCAPLASLIFVAACLATSARAQTQATTLPLMLPSATAFDAAGNLYFAETGNHVVRKVTSGRNYHHGRGQRRAGICRRRWIGHVCGTRLARRTCAGRGWRSLHRRQPQPARARGERRDGNHCDDCGHGRGRLLRRWRRGDSGAGSTCPPRSRSTLQETSMWPTPTTTACAGSRLPRARSRPSRATAWRPSREITARPHPPPSIRPMALRWTLPETSTSPTRTTAACGR